MTGTDEERERGILSTADRRYLQSDPGSYSRQAQHARKTAIHNRLKNGIKDFSIILEHVDKIDTTLILEGENNDESAEMRQGMAAMIGFLFVASRDYHTSFKSLVKFGVDAGARKWSGRGAKTEIEIERYETVDIPRVCEIVEQGAINELTDQERKWVLEMVAEGAELSTDSLRETHRNTSDGRAMKRQQEKIEDYREEN